MKVAVIGSNSFLAREIIKSYEFANEELFLYGIENESKHTNFIHFQFPNNNLNFNEFLNKDVIIYCAGAGIQSNLKEEIELIYELNTFLPIRLINFLKQNKYNGK